VAIAGGGRVLAPIAYVCSGGAAAIQWTHAAMLIALSDLASRGGADAGVLALFTLGSTMDEADGMMIAVALFCAGWLLLRSDRTPALVSWLTLLIAGVVTRLSGWHPFRWRLAGIMIALGVSYTILSEWLNVEVWRSWSYTPVMPVLPWLGTGLSPLFQWILVPAVAFAGTHFIVRTRQRSAPRVV